MKIQTVEDLTKALENKYAFPGGYVLYIVMEDGESLCMDCAIENKELLEENFQERTDEAWIPVSLEILNDPEENNDICIECGVFLNSI